MRSVLLVWFFFLAAGRPAARAAELTAAERQIARKLAVTKCAKCHKFYEPQDYSETDWRAWMEKMNRKSKLKPAQAELLLRYMETLRRPRVPADQPPARNSSSR